MNEPPDQTAEFRAASLLSPGGMTVAQCSRKRSSCSRRAVSVSQKMTPLLLEVLAQRVVDDLALVLGAHAREVLLLGLGDAQAVERVLDVGRDVVPVGALLLRRADEVEDVLEVDLVQVAAPGGHGLALEDLERAEAELQHPLGLALEERDLADDVRVEAALGLEHVVGRVVPAELVLAEIDVGRLDCGHGPSPVAVTHVGLSKGYAHCRNDVDVARRRSSPAVAAGVRVHQTSRCRPSGREGGRRRGALHDRAFPGRPASRARSRSRAGPWRRRARRWRARRVPRSPARGDGPSSAARRRPPRARR